MDKASFISFVCSVVFLCEVREGAKAIWFRKEWEIQFTIYRFYVSLIDSLCELINDFGDLLKSFLVSRSANRFIERQQEVAVCGVAFGADKSTTAISPLNLNGKGLFRSAFYNLKAAVLLIVFLLGGMAVNAADLTVANNTTYTINSTSSQTYTNVTVNGTLYVYGILIVNGDLNMGNNGVLITGANSVIIVYGDANLGNQVSLSLSSYFIVLGDLTNTGSTNQGTLNANNASIYVFGSLTGFGSTFEKCEGSYDGTTTNNDQCEAGGYPDFLNNVEEGDLPTGFYDEIVAAYSSSCTPTYTYGTGWGDYISWVNLGNIDNTTSASGNPYYTYYSSLSTDLTVGKTYTVKVSFGSYYQDNRNYIAVWIDYNQDGSFNSTTEKLGTVQLSAFQTGSINFSVPATAALGTTKMRVREVWNVSNIDPCLNYGYGETEDYVINILDPCATPPTAPTATGATICVGSSQTYTLAASGASAGDKYVWYSSATATSALKTSSSYTDNTYTTGTLTATTNYWVAIMNSYGCESERTQVSVVYPSTSSDSQTTAGTDSWIGHVYKRLDTASQPPSDYNAFTNYYGHITEAETFGEDFDGAGTCFSVLSGTGSNDIYSGYFAVRFRMNSTKTGIYVANISSDDGARLQVDGVQVYNKWIERGYTTDQKILFQLSGSSNLLLEYYESTGDNLATFDSFQKVPNSLSNTDDVTYCQNETASQISANNAYTDSPVSSTSGFSVSYQWQSSSTGTAGWSNISGATAQNYTPSTTTAATVYYRRILSVARTNPGMSSATTATDSNSGVIKITVNSVTTITGQPSSTSQTVCQGGSFSPISVVASGANLTYQWYRNTSASTIGGTALSGNGATSATYTPQTTTVGVTYYYYCVVTGACSEATSSFSGAFLVNPTTVITSQPSTSSQTICQGGTFTSISVTTTGVGLTYKWYRTTSASPSGGSLMSGNGATSSVYTPQPGTSGTTYYYYCVVAGTCGTVNSSISGAFLVMPATTISSQPSTTSRTVCQGGTFSSISVTASGGSLTYQWYSNTSASTSGGTALTGNGATTRTYTPQAATAGTLYYYCVVAGSCGTVTSSISGFYLVKPTTSVTSQSTEGQTICQGSTFTSISLTAVGANLSYQWYRNTSASTSGGSSISGATSSTYTPSASSVGTSYYYCIVSGDCSNATSNVSGAFVVNPTTAISSQATSAQSVCVGDTFNAISITATGTSLTYQWYRNTSASTTGGTIISGATSSSYTPSASNVGTSYYYCVVTGSCSSATSSVSGAFVVSPLIQTNPISIQ